MAATPATKSTSRRPLPERRQTRSSRRTSLYPSAATKATRSAPCSRKSQPQRISGARVGDWTRDELALPIPRHVFKSETGRGRAREEKKPARVKKDQFLSHLSHERRAPADRYLPIHCHRAGRHRRRGLSDCL